MKYEIIRLVPRQIQVEREVVRQVPTIVRGRKRSDDTIETVTETEIAIELETVVDEEPTGKVFEERPAPDQTLGGYLLARKNETGIEHVARELAQSDDAAALTAVAEGA